MLLAPDLTQSYIITGDGLTISSPVINASSIDFAKNSPYAVVQGILYIFGGFTDNYKVSFLFEFKAIISFSR